MKNINKIFYLIYFSILIGNTNQHFIFNDKEDGSRKIDFKIPEINLFSEGEFTKVTSQNSGYTSDIGYPELPTYSIVYHIDPYKEYNISFSVISSHIIEGVIVYPSQNNVKGADIQPFDQNENYYSSNEKYPTSPLWKSSIQKMRGEEFITISITPFSYLSTINQLEIYDDIEIEITEIGYRDNINHKSMPRSQVFEKFMKKISPNYTSRDNEIFQSPSILYICGGESLDEDYLWDLFQWRHERGYIVNTISIDEIGNSSENIYEYIKDAYENWDIPPEFVTIVGDASGSYSVDTNYEYYSGVYGEGDWPYSLLEGDDFFPEIIIGRLSVRTPTHIGTVVNKIINYEKALDESEDWYETASLVSDPYDSGYSTVITNEYIEGLLDTYGFDNINTKYSGGSWATWIENQFNTGTLYMNYRGYYGASGFEPSDVMEDLTNFTKHPFATFLTCDTGSFDSGTYCLSETLLRAGTPAAPIGAIAAVGTATTYTHTAFNNIIAMGIYEGIFIEENYTAGEALAYGKLILAGTYPSNPNNNIDMFSYWNNLMGDASTHLWTKRPGFLTVNHVESIQAGSNILDIEVLDINNDPIQNAFVTLTKGIDDIFISGYTNVSGLVSLVFSDNSGGEALVTVVKQDYKPVQNIITIQNNDIILLIDEPNLDIDDDGSGYSDGNNDGIINPGETIELIIPIENAGEETVSDLTVNILSNSPYVNIISHNISYPSINPGEIFSSDPFVLSVLPLAQDGHNLNLQLEIISDNGEVWFANIPTILSGIRLNIDNYIILEDENNNGLLEPGESCELFISLLNWGSIPSTNIIGNLSSTMPGIIINQSVDEWTSIGPEESMISNNGYEILVNTNIINGTQLNLELVLENPNGYFDTEILTLELGDVTEGDPLGPDNHGYYIYDDGDTNYDFKPTYDWFEIDPDFGGNGIDLNMNDSGNGIFSTSIITVDLPFLITFYGIEYDQITICSNGWISFGETNMESFRNYELPGAGGPSPMIAIFWDDLKTSGGGDVYHYTDPDNEFYIIEWSELRTFNQNSLESFQIIFYDTGEQTPTGDDEILLQYKEFNNTSVGSYPIGFWDDVVHGAYSTVGLENHLGNDGLQYTFNNQYPNAAKELSDQSALFITTKLPELDLGGMLGDINQDNLINVLDVVIIVNHILEEILIEPELMYLADVNQDGLIDILDIVVLVSWIL